MAEARPRYKLDVSVKWIMRAFRQYVKAQFQGLYERRYYCWIKRTLRKHTKDFYLSTYKCISDWEYLSCENIAVLLVHNTKTWRDIKRITCLKSDTIG